MALLPQLSIPPCPPGGDPPSPSPVQPSATRQSKVTRARGIVSALAGRGLNLEDVGKRYLTWWRNGGFDTGPTAANVFDAVSSGLTFEEASERVHGASRGLTAGCNPAHRAAPFAMCALLPDCGLAAAAAAEAKLTHQHPLAGDVSAAVATLLCLTCISGICRKTSSPAGLPQDPTVSQQFTDMRDIPPYSRNSRQIDLNLRKRAKLVKPISVEAHSTSWSPVHCTTGGPDDDQRFVRSLVKAHIGWSTSLARRFAVVALLGESGIACHMRQENRRWGDTCFISFAALSVTICRARPR